MIARKYGGGTDNKRSFSLNVDESGYITIALGYNSGTQYEEVSHGTTLSTGTWYHVTASYQNSDKAWAIRIRNTSGGTVGSDATGTATLDVNKLSVSNTRFTIGAGMASGATTDYFDGLMDEVVVFKDIISSSEATAIAQGSYP